MGVSPSLIGGIRDTSGLFITDCLLERRDVERPMIVVIILGKGTICDELPQVTLPVHALIAPPSAVAGLMASPELRACRVSVVFQAPMGAALPLSLPVLSLD